MQTLFAPDQKELDFTWITERTKRCEAQKWQIAEQLIQNGIDIVFDLGFGAREQRQYYRDRILAPGAKAFIHFLDVPTDMRREQVRRRNQERDPALYAFGFCCFPPTF